MNLLMQPWLLVGVLTAFFSAGMGSSALAADAQQCTVAAVPQLDGVVAVSLDVGNSKKKINATNIFDLWKVLAAYDSQDGVSILADFFYNAPSSDNYYVVLVNLSEMKDADRVKLLTQLGTVAGVHVGCVNAATVYPGASVGAGPQAALKPYELAAVLPSKPCAVTGTTCDVIMMSIQLSEEATIEVGIEVSSAKADTGIADGDSSDSSDSDDDDSDSDDSENDDSLENN